MFVDVVDNFVGNVVADALTALAEEADLGRRHIVLDELRDNVDVISVLLEADKGIV